MSFLRSLNTELTLFLFVSLVAFAGFLSYSDTEFNDLTGEITYSPKFGPKVVNLVKETEIQINSMRENTIASFDLKKDHKIVFLKIENCFSKSPLHQDYSFKAVLYKAGKFVSTERLGFFPQFTRSPTRCDDAYVSFSKETIADKIEIKTQEPKGNPKLKSKIILYVEPASDRVILPVQQPTPKPTCESVGGKRASCNSNCKKDEHSLDQIFNEKGELGCKTNEYCCVKDGYYSKSDSQLTCKQLQTKLKASKSGLVYSQGPNTKCSPGSKYGYITKTQEFYSSRPQGCCLK